MNRHLEGQKGKMELEPCQSWWEEEERKFLQYFVQIHLGRKTIRDIALSPGYCSNDSPIISQSLPSFCFSILNQMSFIGTSLSQPHYHGNEAPDKTQINQLRIIFKTLPVGPSADQAAAFLMQSHIIRVTVFLFTHRLSFELNSTTI